jgi:hypothetical protein
MNTTTALFSELVYDFESEHWNEFELPKLSLRELQALAKLLGCLPSGARKRSSFASSHNVNCASSSLASQTTLTSWRVPIDANPCAICVGKPVFGVLAINALFRRAFSIGGTDLVPEVRRF